ncbi:hypothetical protein ABPG74_009266 [Tetrahymena malaccensis]
MNQSVNIKFRINQNIHPIKQDIIYLFIYFQLYSIFNKSLLFLNKQLLNKSIINIILKSFLFPSFYFSNQLNENQQSLLMNPYSIPVFDQLYAQAQKTHGQRILAHLKNLRQNPQHGHAPQSPQNIPIDKIQIDPQGKYYCSDQTIY